MAIKVAGTLGAKIYVASTALAASFADTASAYRTVMTASKSKEIGLIETFGDFGPQFETVTFTPVATGLTLKFKGPKNQGAMQLAGAMDLSDTGQTVLNAVGPAANNYTYPFKIVFAGGAASGYDTVYFGAKVMGFRANMGAANSVLRWTAPLEITTNVVFTSS